MVDIPSHHFIYGHTTDYVTGEQIVDTDDERYRQKLAKFLVTERGWHKKDLKPRLKIETLFSNNFVVSKIDLVISFLDHDLFIIRYAPGSLVTRERSAIAAARVLQNEYQIPYAIVTNGEDAELLDTKSGAVLATGIACIPTKTECEQLYRQASFTPLPSGPQRERELRVLNTYDVEVCCVGGPCALPDAPEG